MDQAGKLGLKVSRWRDDFKTGGIEDRPFPERAGTRKENDEEKLPVNTEDGQAEGG